MPGCCCLTPRSRSPRATGSASSAGTGRARPPCARCCPARRCRPPGQSGTPGRLATCRRTREPGTWTSSRWTGSCRRAAWMRSAPRCARPRRRCRTRTRRSPRRRSSGTARCRDRLAVLGGYAAESEAASLTASLGLADRVLHQPLHTLSGGQRRRVELARILFGDSQTLLLDEPTNHLDADSITWLRDHLKSYRGGLIVISHDVDLLEHGRQQGVPPGRQPLRARRLQRRLEGVPAAAGDRRAAPPPGEGERRAAGHRAAAAGRQDAAPRRPRPRPRRT